MLKASRVPGELLLFSLQWKPGEVGSDIGEGMQHDSNRIDEFTSRVKASRHKTKAFPLSLFIRAAIGRCHRHLG